MHDAQLEEEGEVHPAPLSRLEANGLYETCRGKVFPQEPGCSSAGHRINSVDRFYNIIDMEVVKEATAKIEEHQRALKPQNNHRTATASEPVSADDKTDLVN